MSVNKILEQIANEPGKNAKIDILKKNKDYVDLKEAVRLAYDPTINFYIKKIPEYVPAGDKATSSLNYALSVLLDDFSTRNVTGNEAFDTLQMLLCQLNADDAKVLAKVVQRDLRAGFTDGTANKVWKNLIPEYPYMRCSLPKHVKMDQLPWKKGMLSQVKANGMFANLNLDDDFEVVITSRAGSVFPLEHFGDLVKDAKASFGAGTQTHGELLIRRDGKILPRQIGNGILNKVQKGGDLLKGDTIEYMVWDNIPLSSVVTKGKCTTRYELRYERLKLSIKKAKVISLIPTEIVHSMKEALVHYHKELANGEEGTIIKSPDGIWKDGTSKEQIKMKLEIDVDLEIIGFNPGKGKNEPTFGSIICQTSDNKLVVNVSGFSDAERLDIHNNRDKLLNTIMTVKSNELLFPSESNDKYSLFLPRCEEFRTDKKKADSVKMVIEQFENAIK